MMRGLTYLAALATLVVSVTAYPRSLDLYPRSLVLRDDCGTGPIIDCERFSPNGNDASQHLCCREYIRGSYPRTIGGRRVDLYRYTDMWDPNNEATISHLADISDALESVLPAYENFGVGFDLIIIFSETLPPIDGQGVYGYEQEKPGETTPCYVRITNTVPAEVPDVDLSFHQTIAHEVYHCVEDANRAEPLPANKWNGWWLEGTPEFYAFDFYPSHEQSAWPRQYDPAIPMYIQSYAVSLYYIYLRGTGWTDGQFNDLVFNEPEATSFAEARESMSGDADIEADFPNFAQAFSNNLIKFSDGSPVDPIKTPVPPKAEPLPLPEGGSNNWIVKYPPFTISSFALALDPGQSFTITWKPTDKLTTIYYRESSDTDWIDITTAPAAIDLTCDDGTTTYEFLFTCTANVKTGAGILSFLQTDKLDCCTGTATASSCPSTTTPPSSPSTTPGSSPTPVPSGALDPCLRGTWNMDLAAMQALLQQKLSDLPSGETVSNIEVTGAASFAIPSTGSTSTFTFSNTDINYDIAATGLTGHTLIDIDGTSTGTVDMQGTGKFIWTNTQATGMVKTTTTTSETTSPIELDFDLSEQYGPGITVNYVCSASTLVMNGLDSTGTRQWSYSFTK